MGKKPVKGVFAIRVLTPYFRCLWKRIHEEEVIITSSSSLKSRYLHQQLSGFLHR